MKRIFHRNIPIVIESSFWVVLVLAIIVLPLQWSVGWILAVAIHELGHLIGIVVLRVPVYSVTIKCSGTYLQTAQMLPLQEIMVAAMGPIFGLIPLFCSRWFPQLAICAMVQFAFNILPFTSFDGGRMLLLFLKMCLSGVKADRIIRFIQIAIMCVFGLLLIHLRWNSIMALFLTILLVRIIPVTFPCKRRKQIVQWSK